MLSSISLWWQRGKGTVPKYFKSDHHHELCYLRGGKKINLACRWAKFNAAKKNASKTAFTSKKSVSSCRITVPNKFHMSDEECSVVLKKRNGRHHLYSYKFSGCLESCCHWKKQDYFSAINKETWQDRKGLEGAVIAEVYIPQHLPAKPMQHRNMSVLTILWRSAKKFPVNRS